MRTPRQANSHVSTFDRRLTLDLTDDTHRQLKIAAVEGRTTMATLLRALVAIWSEDEHLQERVREKSTEIRNRSKYRITDDERPGLLANRP